jgi:hypothetical protein
MCHDITVTGPRWPSPSAISVAAHSPVRSKKETLASGTGFPLAVPEMSAHSTRASTQNHTRM